MPAPHHQAAGVADSHADLLGAIEQMPGGKWIAPHYSDGPYYFVVVLGVDNPHADAAAALRAYPVDYWLPAWDTVSAFEKVAVHAVPEFVRDLLHRHKDAAHLILDEDAQAGPYPWWPDDEDAAVLLPELLGHAGVPGDALHHAIDEARIAAGLAALLRFLDQLDTAVLRDAERLTGALEGVFAPASA